MLASSDLPPLIGRSRAFLDLLDRVSRVAPLDRPVLVIGERGTGKELIAARLHFLSARWEGALVKLNCAALAESLLETELFGHETGAFTGAVKRRIGRFELAHDGTLFLDEIANAGAAVQEKVLRAIEYGEFERVGGNETIRVDVRVIGATNVDLRAAADAGRFRHDLLDRLAFDVLTVPPLRARREDVALLAEHFGRAMANELGHDFASFAPAALEALARYDWPGNVRELRNVAERAVAHWPEPGTPIETIDFDPFASPYAPAETRAEGLEERPAAPEVPPGPRLPDPTQPFDLRERIGDLERHLLAEALAANRHNQRATATHLGLTYHQLRNELKKAGLIGAR